MEVVITRKLLDLLAISSLCITLLASAVAQTPRKASPILSVTPSNIVVEVSERARQSASLNAAELAAYGNDLIAKKGFDYDFDVCEALNHHDRMRTPPEELTYQITLTNGGKLPSDSQSEIARARCAGNVGLRFPAFRSQIRK